MMNFIFHQPVPIHFGIDAIKDLPLIIEKFNSSRGLLVCTPSLVTNGTAKQIIQQSNGKLISVFSAIQQNPTVYNTINLVEKIHELQCDFIVAVGGGSILDCAKMARIVAVHDGDCTDYIHNRKTFSKKGLPIITIPTTSGSASEVSSVSVLTDEVANKKVAIAHPYLFSDYAIIDPRLTVSCPPTVTAISGIDVIAHALEAFYNVHHQPFPDHFAKHAVKLAFDNLELAVKHPHNLEARSKMAEASVAAGVAFSQTGTAAAHACSYPLTQIFGVPHGEACAITLSAFWRLNATADPRLDEMSKELGFTDAHALAARIDEIKQSIGLRMKLADVGVKTEEDLQMLVKESFAPNMANNPVQMTEESLRKFYESL